MEKIFMGSDNKVINCLICLSWARGEIRILILNAWN